MTDGISTNADKGHLTEQILLLVNFVLLTFAFLLLFEVLTRYTGPLPLLADGVGVSMEMLASAVLSGSVTFVGRRTLARLRQRHLSADILIFFASVTLMLLAIMSWTRLSPAAQHFNQQARQLHAQGELQHSKTLYLRAARLQPDNPQIQYNLGTLYEDLADYDSAETAYQNAINGQMEVAYNNLARLLILNGNPSGAIERLQRGLARAEAKSVRYTLYKNLGWAQIDLLLYEEAETSLQTAIELFPEEGAAHCLLARLNQQQERYEEEIAARVNCQRYADPSNVDEAGWIGETRRRLEALSP